MRGTGLAWLCILVGLACVAAGLGGLYFMYREDWKDYFYGGIAGGLYLSVASFFGGWVLVALGNIARAVGGGKAKE